MKEAAAAAALGCWQLAVWQAALGFFLTLQARFSQLLSDWYYHLSISWTEVFVGGIFSGIIIS